MAKKLDIEVFNENTKCIKIGSLTNKMVCFIKNNCKLNNIVEILSEKDILLWDNRIEYTEKHKGNFKTSEEYYSFIEDIPSIIESPDFIGIPTHNDSIQFIKIVNRVVIVAVRISNKGGLSYRTLYPITESQLKDYIKKNKAWKFNQNIDFD